MPTKSVGTTQTQCECREAECQHGKDQMKYFEYLHDGQIAWDQVNELTKFEKKTVACTVHVGVEPQH